MASSCANNLANSRYFHDTLPTLFQNANGETIQVSTEGLLIDGAFYEAKDCSNDSYLCFTYGHFAAIVTRKKCYQAYQPKWVVRNIVAEVQGFEIHSAGFLVMTSLNDRFAYWFSDNPGVGVITIGYDSTATFNVRAGSRFFADIPAGQAGRMMYSKLSGPDFMACVAPHQ